MYISVYGECRKQVGGKLIINWVTNANKKNEIEEIINRLRLLRKGGVHNGRSYVQAEAIS